MSADLSSRLNAAANDIEEERTYYTVGHPIREARAALLREADRALFTPDELVLLSGFCKVAARNGVDGADELEEKCDRLAAVLAGGGTPQTDLGGRQEPPVAEAIQMLDFPTAWELCRTGEAQPHHEKCSYIVTTGALLCDCGAVESAWRTRCSFPAQQDSATAESTEVQDLSAGGCP